MQIETIHRFYLWHYLLLEDPVPDVVRSTEPRILGTAINGAWFPLRDALNKKE